MSRILLSILVPVYNEEDNVEPIYQRLIQVMGKVSDRYDFEILFTDNHSTDGTFQRLERIAREDPRVRVYRFSRNFGFQKSILTGLNKARGAAAVQIDCDLQDPPELIIDFLREWEAGCKVVYGVRRSRQEGKLISKLRDIFYWLIDRLSEFPLPRGAGDFRLLDRRILDELRKLEDAQPYLRGAVAELGFRQKGIPYDREARTMGESKFPLSKLLSLALDGILNHSVVPLRIATFLGLIFSSVSFFGMLFYFIGKVILGYDWPAGFTTLTMLVLLSLGLNALFLGIIGEYVGRIYKQVKRNQTTIIETELNP